MDCGDGVVVALGRALVDVWGERVERLLDGVETQAETQDVARVLKEVCGVVEGRRRELGEEDAWHGLVRVVEDQGRYGEALEVNRAVLVVERCGGAGPEHPSIPTTRHTIALVLQSLGQSADAVPAVLAVEESVHADHPTHHCACTAVHKAVCGCSVGSAGCGGARPEHPSTLTTRHTIALALQSLG